MGETVMRFGFLPAVMLLVTAAPVVALGAEGYAGQQTRDIKALSADDVADLLAGRGMGLAKPAELNHYPGPAHVLEMRDPLGLSPEQVGAIEASFRTMSDTAKPLGAELVERERALDRGFADGTMTAEALRTETLAIGELQGRLRAVHLAAHLETRAILTPLQVQRYDALRGYGSEQPRHHHEHGG
jgi:hypothetical protein